MLGAGLCQVPCWGTSREQGRYSGFRPVVQTPDNHFIPSRLRGVLQRSTGFCEGVLALSSSCALPRLMRKGLEKEAGFGSGQLLMKRGEVMAQVWPN